MSSFVIPSGDVSVEQEIKRSRFITHAGRAQDRDQAEMFIREIRNQYPDARHVCWAYIAGAPNTTVTSMSDDGEPSGTAGRPMLNVLQHSGFGEIVVAVVRYFGGIKLGTGGLQRAYGGAVSAVLERLPSEPFVPSAVVMCECDFAHEAAVRKAVADHAGHISEVQYGARIRLEIILPCEQVETCRVLIGNHSSGAASFEMMETQSDS
ncbi:YigZ family protein [Marinibactrum halimedae]|nr:YigZ family protein [Marinibactrum halimedae]MCD9457474.1 YigZ family protein [Marinibactrum halimedae]